MNLINRSLYTHVWIYSLTSCQSDWCGWPWIFLTHRVQSDSGRPTLLPEWRHWAQPGGVQWMWTREHKSPWGDLFSRTWNNEHSRFKTCSYKHPNSKVMAWGMLSFIPYTGYKPENTEVPRRMGCHWALCILENLCLRIQPLYWSPFNQILIPNVPVNSHKHIWLKWNLHFRVIRFIFKVIIYIQRNTPSWETDLSSLTRSNAT